MCWGVHEDVAVPVTRKLDGSRVLDKPASVHSENVAKPFVFPFPNVTHEVIRAGPGAGFHMNASACDPV